MLRVTDPGPDVEAKLRSALTDWPELADRIARQLLIVLHNEGLVSIDAVYDEARTTTRTGRVPRRGAPWSAKRSEKRSFAMRAPC